MACIIEKWIQLSNKVFDELKEIHFSERLIKSKLDTVGWNGCEFTVAESTIHSAWKILVQIMKTSRGFPLTPSRWAICDWTKMNMAFFNHIWTHLLGVYGNPLEVFMTCTNICQVLCTLYLSFVLESRRVTDLDWEPCKVSPYNNCFSMAPNGSRVPNYNVQVMKVNDAAYLRHHLVNYLQPLLESWSGQRNVFDSIMHLELRK